MEKKTFSVYESPKTEVVEVEAQSVICASNLVTGPEDGGMEDL